MLRKMWSGGEVQRWMEENVRLEVAVWEITEEESGRVRYAANTKGWLSTVKIGESFRPLYYLTGGSRD